MKSNFSLFLTLTLLVSTVACTKDIPFPCAQEMACMRIKNVSNYHFTELKVNGTDFGVLKKSRVSEYAGYPQIHDYPYVELKINGLEFHTFGICGTGLQYYNSGAFTCEIDVSDYGNRILDVRLKKH